MKTLFSFAAVATFVSIQSFAQTDTKQDVSYDRIKSIHSYAEVRLLGRFDQLVKNYLRDEIGANVSANGTYGNVDVTIDFRFNGWNWLGFERPADAQITLTKSYLPQPIVLKTRCAAEVKDGGNQTARYSCVRKVARLMARQLKWPEF